MASRNVAHPSIVKIYMIGIWAETLLYGINCAMYGLCMFILLRGEKIVTLRWMLVVMSTILFLLCTVHVGASLQQLLDVFVYAPADVPDYITTYFLNFDTTPRVLKDALYGILLLAQHVVQIWRLYVVFMYDWRVVVLPIILTTGCAGSSYSAAALTTLRDGESKASSSVLLLAWASGFTFNVFVTTAIAGRLWWMGRTMASLAATKTNRFASSIYIAIESGVIAVVISTIAFAIYTHRVALAGLDVASQLVALAPLLIIVQVGLTNRYRISNGDRSKSVLTTPDEIQFRVGILGEQDSPDSLSLFTILSRSGSESDPTHDARVVVHTVV